MYLGIDIGGTKTLVGCLDEHGVIQEQIKFPTPKDYDTFLRDLAINVAKLSTKDFRACGVGVPGRLDRKHGRAIALGNLPWKNIPIEADVEAIAQAPTLIENDTKLGGLSEAQLAKEYGRVLYITVSTGISIGLTRDGKLDPALIDAEAGNLLLEHNGKLMRWEQFASGKAIFERFNKKASDITDPKAWKSIAHNLAIGILNLVVLIQPDIIKIGGSIGAHFDSYGDFLRADLERYSTPLTPMPPIVQAKRPEQAVLYGCYDLIKQHYGHLRS